MARRVVQQDEGDRGGMWSCVMTSGGWIGGWDEEGRTGRMTGSQGTENIALICSCGTVQEEVVCCSDLRRQQW